MLVVVWLGCYILHPIPDRRQMGRGGVWLGCYILHPIPDRLIEGRWVDGQGGSECGV